MRGKAREGPYHTHDVRSTTMREDHRPRCSWAASSDSMRAYHDTEWGVPLHDDRALFEFLCLEGAQAGLSWRTVLDKRENYRRAFAGFDIARCARVTDRRIGTLVGGAGPIPHRMKITARRDNARRANAAIDQPRRPEG